MAEKGRGSEEIKNLLNINLKKLGELDILEDGQADEEMEEARKKFSLPKEKAKEKNAEFQSMSPEKIAELPAVKNVEEKFKDEKEEKPEGNPLRQKLKQIKFSDRSEEYLEKTEAKYDSAIVQTRKLYETLIEDHFYSNKTIRNMIQSFIEVLMEDQCILVNFSTLDQEPKDYLFHHALNTCLLSVNIATIMGYSEEQILDVGEAGLLADLGMMLTPEEIRKKPGKLNGNEQFEVYKHPIVGVYFIERVMGLPERISYVSYQHHERLTGKGYPRMRTKRIIHEYSKIIAIADIYEAMTSSRPYREAMHPFDAMLELMKMAKQGLLEMRILRGILPVTSIYPVGCLVKLSNNCIAKVVKSNGTSGLTQPVVTVITDEDGDNLERKDMYQVDLLEQKDDYDIINTVNFREYKNLKSTAGF